jgi:protein SCO1/2
MNLLCHRFHALLLTLAVLAWPVVLHGHRVSGSDTHTGPHKSNPAAEAAQSPAPSTEQPPEQPNAVRLGVEEKTGGFVPLDLVFTNDRGEQVRLGQLVDRPTLLVPVYFNCPTGCIMELANLADAVRRSQRKIGSFRAISLSFDATETPAMAAAARPNFTQMLGKDFPEDAWAFLTGDQETVRQLTESIGFSFQKMADGTFVHPSTMVVLAPDGQIIKYVYGTFLSGDVDLALAEAAKGEPASSIRRFLEFCLPANPKQVRQVLDALKWVSLGLLVAGGIGLVFLLRRKPSDRSRFEQ